MSNTVVVEMRPCSLSNAENRRLQVLESQIIYSAHQLGKALWEIKDSKLYRDYGTWEDYISERFAGEFTRMSADRHITAFVESENVKKHLLNRTHAFRNEDEINKAVDGMSQRNLLALAGSGMSGEERAEPDRQDRGQEAPLPRLRPAG